MKIYGSRDLGARLHQWHSGMDAVYGVGSMFYAGYGATPERVDDALGILRGIHRRRNTTPKMPRAHARELAALIGELELLREGGARDNPGTRSRPARRAPQKGFTVFLLDLDSHEGIAHYDANARAPVEGEASARTWAEDNLRDGWDLVATVRGKDGAPTPGGFTVFLLDLDTHEGVVIYDGKARSAKAAVAAVQKWADRRLRDGYDIVGVLRGEVTPVNEPDGGIPCRWVDL